MHGATFTMNSDGAALIRETERLGLDLMRLSDYGPGFTGFCGKLTGLHARLALVLHYLDEAILGRQPKPLIPNKTIWRAGQLITRFVLRHASTFYGAYAGDGLEQTRSLADWILRCDKDIILVSDITSSIKFYRGKGLKELQDAVAPLVGGG
jgi:hypothetical protein